MLTRGPHKNDESEKSLSRVQLFVTPWTIQSMGCSRPEYWSGQPFPSPGDLPSPGIQPRSPALQVDSLPAEPQGKQCRRPWFDPWVGKIRWRRERLPTPVFWPGGFHGQRSLVGYSPYIRKESDTQSNTHTHTHPLPLRLPSHPTSHPPF